MMKKLLFLIIPLLSYTLAAQDVVYNFNTDNESFTQGGFPNFSHNSDGYLTTGDATTFTGGFQSLRTPDNLNLPESQYRIVRVVVENSTANTTWQLMNLQAGSTAGNTAGLTEVTIPTVASGSGFTTYDIAITTNPNNTDGIIHRIAFRAKQSNSFDWSAGGELKIAQMVIIDTDQWIANSGFEGATGWTANGADITAGYTTTDPYRGTQAGTVTFTQNATTAGNWFENDTYDFGETLGLTNDEITLTFWVKSTRAGVNIRARFQFYDAGGSLVGSAQFTGVTAIAAADTWQEISFTKTGITDDFNQIKVSLGIHNNGVPAQAGDVISFDFVTSDFNTFTTSNSWTGSADTDWTNTANWTNGVVPSATLNSDIQVSANNPIIGSSTGATVNNLEVDSGASLTVNSGGSLIVNGTSTGNVTYQVLANDTNWHLLSSPVVGATYDGTWIADNDIDDTTGTGTNIALATYTNTADADGDWNYATDASNTGTFNSGQGYSIKRDATSNTYLSFTGTIKSDNLTSTIDQSANNWNLVGNPYASYILVSDLISDNAANLTDTHEMVYVWNGTAYIALSGTDYIHPGQGFFVNADNSTADNFTIDASKLSSQTGVTLYKESSKTAITLSINDGTNTKTTEINYSDDKTKGLDPSFDVGTFTGVANNFSVYTQLVASNQGVDFMRQSLPNSDYENTVVPVGVIAAANKEITFTAEALNLPKGVEVYLEDRKFNTFTLLGGTNSNYKTILDTQKTDGRFFLHTKSSSVLSTEDALLNSVSIYKTNSNNLKITGLNQGKASISLYNLLGKKVMATSFNASNVNNISLPNLSTGLYIVKLEAEKGTISKKIILE